MPDTTAGIFYIPFTTRNQMYMAMKNRLAGGGSRVDADVEADNESVFLKDLMTEFANELIDGEQFVTRKIEIAFGMSSRQYQRMQGRYGKRIPNRKR